MRVLMIPLLKHFRSEESGIKRVIEAYHKYAPEYGIEFVDDDQDYDLKVSHAGTNTENIDVAMLHGLYWTADHPSASWQWKANANVIDAARQARIITVPSQWVAETVMRDMHRTPIIVGHGIDIDEWDHTQPKSDYVLWNKNRAGVDVCDPATVGVLAQAFPDRRFITTFGPQKKRQNIQTIGLIPHEQMKQLIQGAGCYLSTTKETFGIGTLEAMAAGIPVLGYAYGGNLELVQHGVNGYLAQPDNERDLVEGLSYCLQYAQVLGENGRELAKQFTWKAAMAKVASIFESALIQEAPSVSIIIPSYMYADKVGRAIESALRQTYNLVTHVVVVDDGSLDDGATRAVVEEWSLKDARVVYLRQENQGVAVARNTGIAYVDTKYVSCLDADDAMEPQFIERCVRELERDNSLGLAYTRIRHVLPDGRTGVSPWPGEWDFDAQLKRRNQVPTCNVFRRDIWKALGGYRKRYCPMGAGSEDAEFWTRIGAYGWKCKLVTQEPLFIYSLGTGQVSGNKEYTEPDWLMWHPWAEDREHPFASYATPTKWSHPVRQYDEPVVSVIIPVGPNHDERLEDALDSVEGQTSRQWECIVVWDRDDEVPQSYMDAYPFVKWRSIGRNRGAGFARNFGATFARAPFLLFLDADDYLFFNCIDRMLEEWITEEAIIYSDYMGKAFIDDPEKLSLKLQRNIEWRDDDGLTVILYETPEYDVNRAQRQPESDPNKVYTWNLITSLIPKAWHDEVGGFDEQMESWEDVDYWWRLAKAGKCFRRVAEPLVVYLFYSGGRREKGLEKHQQLFQYLIDKHDREEIMPCSGCGRKAAPRPTVTRAASESSAQSLMLQDEQFKKCMYNHPNRGQHTVIGDAVFRNRVEGLHMIRNRNGDGFRIHYGFRGGGEQFLVHDEDIKLAPHLYLPVKQEPRLPRADAGTIGAPTALADVAELAENHDEPEQDVHSIDLDRIMKPPEPIRSNEGYDLQKLPGVTAKIAARLEGYDLEDIIEAGIEGLQEIEQIGPTRARSIYNAAIEASSRA